MILTDYYRFEKIAVKAKMRLDCTASTESYPLFEQSRATKPTKESSRFDATAVGDLVVYYGNVPDRFGGDVHRKADKSLSMKGKNLSSVFVPNPASNLAYGDVKGTADALLLVLNGCDVISGELRQGAAIEMFVARGYSKDRISLYNLLCDGQLDEEIEKLRSVAKEKHLHRTSTGEASEADL